MGNMESTPFNGQERYFLEEILENGVVVECSRCESEEGVYESEKCDYLEEILEIGIVVESSRFKSEEGDSDSEKCDYVEEIIENGIVVESRYKSEGDFDSDECELSNYCLDSSSNKSVTVDSKDVNTSSGKEESHSDDLSSILEDVQSLPCKQSNR